MVDASEEPDTPDPPASDVEDDAGEDSVQSLREQVEAKYDFENFGPRDMAEMSAEEWEAVFDADTWITGTELLDRVEADLRTQVANRSVFAVVKRLDATGDDRVLAYSDEGYAIVYPDGTVEGQGTVLRDVKPTVALSSMPDYEVSDPPADGDLPEPDDVPQSSGELGNFMLQIIGGSLVLSGLVLGVAAFVADLGGAALIAGVVSLVFLGVGVVMFFTVANARLSDRFRAEEYRERLRAAGVDDGEIPAFVPVDPEELDGSGLPEDELPESELGENELAAPTESEEESSDGSDDADHVESGVEMDTQHRDTVE